MGCETEADNIMVLMALNNQPERLEKIGSADGSCSLDTSAGYGQVVCINGL
jgi:hypothetical protein